MTEKARSQSHPSVPPSLYKREGLKASALDSIHYSDFASYLLPYTQTSIIHSCSMANTDKTVNASKLRDPILDSADRIAAAEVPKKMTHKKRLSKPTVPTKRPASAAFELSDDMEEIIKPSTADAAPRPVKQPMIRESNHDSGPLAITTSSRVNIVNSNLQNKWNQTQRRPDDEFAAALTLAELHASHSPPFPRGVPFESQQVTGAIHPGEGSGFGSSQRREDIRQERSAPIASKLLASSAASSSIDGIDYFDNDLDDADLRNLHDFPPSGANASNQSQLPPPSTGRSMRHLKMSLDFITTETPASTATHNTRRPTSPSPASGSVLSLSSTSTSLTQLSHPPPFIRNNPAEDMGLRLYEAPSLRAESRSPTCFRMYEIYRLQAGQAATTATALKVELFAAVVQSYRRTDNQFFRFADLFYPHQPPHLTGTYTQSLTSDFNGVDSWSLLTDTISRRGPKGGAISRKKHDELLSKMPYKIFRAVIQLETSRPAHISPRPQPTDVKVLMVRPATAEEIEYLRSIVELQQPLRPDEVEGFDASQSRGRWNQGQREVHDHKTAK